jgi:hypothetical protein
MQKLKDGALAVLRNRVELPMRNMFDATIISTESKPKGRIKSDEIEKSGRKRKVSFNKEEEVLGEATEEDEFVIISSSVQKDDQIDMNIADNIKTENDIGNDYDIINDNSDADGRILLNDKTFVEMNSERQHTDTDINTDMNEHQEFKVGKRKMIDEEDQDNDEGGDEGEEEGEGERERRVALEMMMGLDDSSSGGDSDSDNDGINNASGDVVSNGDKNDSDNDSEELDDNDILVDDDHNKINDIIADGDHNEINDIIVDDDHNEIDKNQIDGNVSTIDYDIELSHDNIVAEDTTVKVTDIEDSVKDRRMFKDLHHAAWAIFISTLGLRTVRYLCFRCLLCLLRIFLAIHYVMHIFP